MLIREARLADAADLAKVQVDTWRKTYEGIVPSDYLANMMYTEAERHWLERLGQSHHPEWFILVAEDFLGRVTGFAAAGPERARDHDFSGEVYAIYVLPEHQKKGIGKKLFLESTTRLIDRGHLSLLVWVLEENPSRGFYESLGGELVRRREIEIGGMNLPEVGYGWRDAAVLLSRQNKKQAA